MIIYIVCLLLFVINSSITIS